MATWNLSSRASGVCDRIVEGLCDRLWGPWVRFETHLTSVPVADRQAAGATPPSSPDPFQSGSGGDPLPGARTGHSAIKDARGLTDHQRPASTDGPGHGRHANDCLYIDADEHRCVAADGQPSTVICWSSTIARAGRVAS